MNTFGPSYNEEIDGKRIKTQRERIRDYMIGHEGWRTLDEIQRATRDPAASISAQLRHLRKEKFGSYLVDKRRRGGDTSGLWEYRLRVGDLEETTPKPKSEPRKNKSKPERTPFKQPTVLSGVQLGLFDT